MKQPYVIFNVGDEEYKLKFSASAAVDTEKRLKCSLIDATSRIDSITVQIAILHGALQKYQHNISYNQAEEIYEKYLDTGKGILDFAELIMEIYEVSGFMKEEQVEKAKEVMADLNLKV